jgi:hypothetical protein
MEDIRTSWGETLPFGIYAENGVSATLNIGEIGDIVVSSTSPFDDGFADLTVDAFTMEIPVGDYSYQVVVEYDNGDIRKYPDASCEDCELPTITVCPSIDMPGGS